MNTNSYGHALFIGLLLLFLMNCTGSEAPDPDTASSKNALLFRTQTWYIYSEIMQDSFEIKVSLPAEYYQEDTVFSTLYSTDAPRSFGIISGVVNALTFPSGLIQNQVVVGIGYPLKGLEDWAARRHSEYTPTYDSLRSAQWEEYLSELSGRENLHVHSGKADDLLEFLKKELIPFIESEYRVSTSERAIFGYSLGGLFSLYSLFQSPETFQWYFAGSPSTWWDDGVIFDLEKKFAANHSDLKAKLFMSVGEYESETMVKNMWKMDSLLHSRNYESLQIHSVEFQGQIHQTCYPEAVTKALMVLYGE